jgi:hypothetical protein
MMTFSVYAWWAMLCAFSALNIAAWAWSAWALGRHESAMPAPAYALRRIQLLLSAGYVAGCAFRSVFPVYDIPRLGLFDSPLSSAFVGRSVATVAELCFAAQWALMLRESSRTMASGVARVASKQIVPLIVIAEICSWYSVLTTSNLGHVIEESLWGLSAVLVVASLFTFWPRCAPAQRPLLALGCLTGMAYIAYMFSIDVPMYWQRWAADDAIGHQYLSLAQGLLDASGRWVVSAHWDDWKSEVVWMSLYFTGGVWLSIGLIHAPVLQSRRASRGNKRPGSSWQLRGGETAVARVSSSRSTAHRP